MDLKISVEEGLPTQMGSICHKNWYVHLKKNTPIGFDRVLGGPFRTKKEGEDWIQINGHGRKSLMKKYGVI